jgi:Domain of unknown function (DUF1508)
MNGEHRWRVVAGNGRIVAVSGEGYKNKSDCLGEAKQLFLNMKFEDDEEDGEE